MQFQMKRVMCAVDGHLLMQLSFSIAISFCVSHPSQGVSSQRPHPSCGFQLLNQLQTSPHTPSDWLNAEVWRWRRKREWASEWRHVCQKHTEFDGFVDNLKSVDKIKFSLLAARVCFILGVSAHAVCTALPDVWNVPRLFHNWWFVLYRAMQRPRPPQDSDSCRIPRALVWSHSAHFWVTWHFMQLVDPDTESTPLK